MRSLPTQYQKRLIALAGLVLLVLPMLRFGRNNVPALWDDIGVVFAYALNLLVRRRR